MTGPSNPPPPSGPPRAGRALEAFSFPATGQQIRAVLRDGEPWFIAGDLALALDYRDTHNATRVLDEIEKGTHEVSTPGGPQSVTVVSEPGLYRLVMRSNKPNAIRFQMWIAHEVVPAIRRDGRYEMAPAYQLPQSYSEALRELASMVDRAEQAESRLAIAAPKAIAWDTLASTDADYSVREAAHILNRDPGIDTGQQRLFAALRALEVVDRRNRPYAAHSRHARLRPTYYTHPRTGEEIAAQPQVRITVEGLRYLHKRFGGTDPFTHLAPAPAMEASA